MEVCGRMGSWARGGARAHTPVCRTVSRSDASRLRSEIRTNPAGRQKRDRCANRTEPPEKAQRRRVATKDFAAIERQPRQGSGAEIRFLLTGFFLVVVAISLVKAVYLLYFLQRGHPT